MINQQISPSMQIKLQALIAAARNIQASTVEDNDLFGDKTHTVAKLAVHFFENDILHRNTLSKNALIAIESCGAALPNNPLEAYSIANAPDHPIRNYLIRNEIDLIDENRA